MSEHIDDEAAAWFVAQHRDDMDWDAFTRWLEADARHPAAFDAIALLDERIDRALPELRALGENQSIAAPRSWRPARWMAAGGGLAAAAAIALVFVSPASSSRPLTYRTAPGQGRDIALLDGSKVALAPANAAR
jgi:transmembrane sensor